MEWGVVARHGPDDAEERHEDGDTIWPFCSIADCSPDCCAICEFGNIDCCGGDEDDNDEENQEIHRCANRVESGNVQRRHRRDESMDNHNERCEEENLIIFNGIIGVIERCC
jgi:hypothetical protein